MKKKNYKRGMVLVLMVALALIPVSSALAANGVDSNEVQNMIDVNGEDVVLTQSVETVVNSDELADYGFIISAIDNNSNISVMSDDVYIDQKSAINASVERVEMMTSSSADAVNAVLVNFSDTDTQVLPDTDISLMNIPVWLVTFDNVQITRGHIHGTDTVNAKVNVVVDAYSGEVLEVFSYVS